MTPLPQTRFSIRDRAHAREIARQLPFGDLFKNGGSEDGFADWLFVNRQTFNARNPLQQARVYANNHWHASKRGANFDSLCREGAERQELAWAEAVARLYECLAAVEAWWSETPIGADLTLAFIELCLGGGTYFAEALGGPASSDCHWSWVLEWILSVLEKLGGSDDSLNTEWTPQMSHDYFRRIVEREGTALTRIRQNVRLGGTPTGVEFVNLACCIRAMSKVLGVRTALRAHVVRAMMSEKIEAATPTGNEQRPSRRRRDI